MSRAPTGAPRRAAQSPSRRPYQGWRRLLSHHGPSEAHHCVRLPVGDRGWALCARCLALYPAVLVVVGLEAGFGALTHPLRWFLGAALVTPAVIDWSRARLFAVRGSQAGRMITGALAGGGLGLGFSDYLRDSNPGWFWVLLGLLAALVALVWFAAGAVDGGPEGAPEGEDDAGDADATADATDGATDGHPTPPSTDA